jgi:nitroreductase
MDVQEAVASRYSCRAFLDTPVPESVVRDIVEQAARSPSGGNIQPWFVHAVSGEPLARLKAQIALRAEEHIFGDGAEYHIYPRGLKEPYNTRRHVVGELLYRSIGVAREDKQGRRRQYRRNYLLFDAPVALFFALDRSLGPPQWSDLGMYLQTVMLLARSHGLHTCPQEAWTYWHKTLGAFLELPPEHILFCGMALGHADPKAAINGWDSPRALLCEFATFRGF